MPRAGLTAVAGVLLVQTLVGPDVYSRSRPVRHVTIGLAVSGILWALLIGAKLALDLPAAERFGGPSALLPLPVWATVLALGVGRSARHRDPLAAAVTALAFLQLAATSFRVFDAAWAGGAWPSTPLLSLAAWMLVTAGLLHLLRVEAQRCRCELHLRGVQHELDLADRQRRERERRHEARNALLALEATTTALWRHDLSPTDGDRDELGRITADLVDELRALLVTDAASPNATSSGVTSSGAEGRWRTDPASANPEHADATRARCGHAEQESQAAPGMARGTARGLERGAPDQGAGAPTTDPAAGPSRLDLAEVARLEAAIARAQGLEVQVAATHDAIAHGELRPTRQVVRNLLMNVARHAAGTRTPWATLLVHREGRQVVLRCIDDGPGIPAHLGERVFSPSDRLDTEGRGDGLGLAIARELARTQGGDLGLAASAAGACFVLRLPADLAAVPNRQAPHEVDDLIEVREPDQRNPVRPVHRATPRRPLSVVEHEHESGGRRRSGADGDREVDGSLVIDLDLEVVPCSRPTGEPGGDPAGPPDREGQQGVGQHLHLQVVGRVPGADEQAGERVGEQPRRRRQRDPEGGAGPGGHTPA